MPSLPQVTLHAKLRAGLPAGTIFSRGTEIHPAEISVPGLGDIRVYLWTITHVESDDRPPDEYKVQLILPGQTRVQRGELAIGDKPTFLLGYSPDFGVFVGWEARLHADFAFSSAKQIRESTLEESRRSGWAVAPLRTLAAGPEVRVAFSPANLFRYFRESIRADTQGLVGTHREAVMLAATPNFDAGVIDLGAAPEGATRRIRQRLLVSRSRRDAKFGPLVKKQYQSGCAICGVQLGIIEGAHIIPASVENGVDEIWNGVALCPNHHKLFDASALVVTPTLFVRVDDTAVAFFRESGIQQGVDEELTVFHDQAIRSPAFFAADATLRNRMVAALTWRMQMAAFAV